MVKYASTLVNYPLTYPLLVIQFLEGVTVAVGLEVGFEVGEDSGLTGQIMEGSTEEVDKWEIKASIICRAEVVI